MSPRKPENHEVVVKINGVAITKDGKISIVDPGLRARYMKYFLKKFCDHMEKDIDEWLKRQGQAARTGQPASETSDIDGDYCGGENMDGETCGDDGA